MAALFEDNFEIYGNDEDRANDGVWSEFDATLIIPPLETKGRYWARIDGIPGEIRAALGGSYAGVGAWFEYYTPELPTLSTQQNILEFLDASGSTLLRLRVTPTGDIQVTDTVTVLGITSAPVLRANTRAKIQVEANFDGAAGDVEIRVDGVSVLTLNALAIPGTAAQIAHAHGNALQKVYYLKAVAYYSLEGAYNNSWPDIAGVALSLVNADTVVNNLTPRTRTIFGESVGAFFGNSDEGCVDAGVSTDFDIGVSDYTLEGWFHFTELPTTTDRAVLIAKYNPSGDNRSYMLVANGPDRVEAPFEFVASEDGTLTNRETVHALQFLPEIGHTYHIAVCRDGTDNRLFINGVQQGLTQADARNYYAATAKTTLGSHINGTSFGVDDESNFYGVMDEVRLTIGTARYTSNFIPAGPFPRDLAGDASFADVQLLCGFEAGVTDESSTGRSLTTYGAATSEQPADAPEAYKTVGMTVPVDDSYLEASLIAASAELTFAAIPDDGDTVTVDGETWTFNTVLAAGNSILIEATIADTLVNLADAVNGAAGEGSRYGTGSAQSTTTTALAGTPSAEQVLFTADTAGTAGNTIVVSTASTNGSWDNPTLTGGQEIPGASEFTIEQLPPTATGLRWLSSRTRAYVPEGAAAIRTDFSVSGTPSLGDSKPVAESPTYYIQRFEEDPSTAAALTPNSMVNGTLVLQRVT